MPRQKSSQLSAQVVLRPASGIVPVEPITSKNIEQILPSPNAAALARDSFAAAGFEVGNLVGNSFSITGPLALFNKHFKTSIAAPSRERRMARLELPSSALPRRVAGVVQAVTFTPPPDFGPTSY